VANGASLIAKWKDGTPLVACRNDVVSVVGLNFYPVSNQVWSYGWDKNTDGWKLMANSLKWAAEGGASSWITGTPLLGSLTGGKTEEVKLSINSNNLAEGNYTAEVRFESNDPKTPYFPVKVNLLVRNNQAPIANSSTVQLKEDTQKSFTLNAVDPDGDSIRYIITNSPKNGKVTGNGKTLTYLPNTNYFGKDELSFKATDGKKEGNTAKVTFIIDAVNDAPWIKSETIFGKEDELIVITPKYGDPEGDRVQVQLVQKPKNGYVHNQGNKWLFFPNANYNGKDSLRFSATDGKLKAEALINLQIEAVNDAPLASNSIIETEEGAGVECKLNATDPENEAISYRVISGPKHGKLLWGKSGKCTYTPFDNYNGKDSFSFRASDKNSEGNLGIVNIEVSPKNEAPQVMDATFALDEDGQLPIKLIASDPDGDSISYNIEKKPVNGTLSGSGPTYRYTPDANYHGTDSFMVTATDGKLKSKTAKISLNITSKNDAPTFVTSLKTPEIGFRETPYRLELQVNDSDGDSLEISVKSAPVNGTCHIKNKELLYLPDPGFIGIEEIQLEVSDGTLSSETSFRLPIEEHTNPIGIFINLSENGTNEQAFVNMIYELNEQLKETANYILRMEESKTVDNFEGTLTDKLPNGNIMTLEQWKEQLPSVDLETSFSFYPKMGNDSISWKVAYFSAGTSSVNTDLDNNKTYASNPSHNEASSPPASSAGTEVGNKDTYTESGGPIKEAPKMPVLSITDLPAVEKIESAPNWFIMPGIGSFFSTGNGWIYQAEIGWCFTIVCPNACSAWIYNENLGWLWMSNELPNMTYSIGELGNGWVYFPETSIGKSKVVFNYENDMWIKVNN
jgi:hypothetical protein